MSAVALYFPRLGQAGGAERMICQVADGLSRRGFSVHLMSLDRAGAESYYPIAQDVTWHRLGQSTDFGGKIARVRAMAALIRANHVRVFIGFVMSGDKTVYAASKIGGARLVAAERNGPSMYRFRFGAWQRRQCFALLHLCDAITVQFPQYIQGYPRSLRNRMVSIPNPVAPGRAAATPESACENGRFQLLAVARFDGVQKRLACLIEAFARIASQKPDWDLKIIGEGGHEAALRDLIADLRLKTRVTLAAPAQDIQAAYARANLFVMPSRWEGFPNALAEALSAGLPAVGFARAEGVAHLISDGVTGWLAGRGDEAPSPDSELSSALAGTLAGTLGEAMSDGAERARRGRNAIQEMSRYGPEAQYDLWAGLVHQLAAAP